MFEEMENSGAIQKVKEKKKETNGNSINEKYSIWNKNTSFKEIKNRLDTAEKRINKLEDASTDIQMIHRILPNKRIKNK